mmetsp:Transcript_19626/g.39659  ORF Transcript_19626/g.39659 Transcript_19626/m.39659 type:complete len:111 (+) Transcript_19626:495-827(+)
MPEKIITLRHHYRQEYSTLPNLKQPGSLRDATASFSMSWRNSSLRSSLTLTSTTRLTTGMTKSLISDCNWERRRRTVAMARNEKAEVVALAAIENITIEGRRPRLQSSCF